MHTCLHTCTHEHMHTHTCMYKASCMYSCMRASMHVCSTGMYKAVLTGMHIPVKLRLADRPVQTRCLIVRVPAGIPVKFLELGRHPSKAVLTGMHIPVKLSVLGCTSQQNRVRLRRTGAHPTRVLGHIEGWAHAVPGIAGGRGREPPCARDTIPAAGPGDTRIFVYSSSKPSESHSP